MDKITACRHRRAGCCEEDPDLKECTFIPKINLESVNRNRSVSDLFSWNVRKQSRIDLSKRREIIKSEYGMFIPKLSPLTERMTSGRSKTRNGRSIHDDLYRRGKKSEFRKAEISEEAVIGTFKPIINKKSSRIAERFRKKVDRYLELSRSGRSVNNRTVNELSEAPSFSKSRFESSVESLHSPKRLIDLEDAEEMHSNNDAIRKWTFSLNLKNK